MNYERALKSGYKDSEKHMRICQSGIARSAIGAGDVHKGILLSRNSGDLILQKQCAALLEENKVT